jgi:hypothetical protein
METAMTIEHDKRGGTLTEGTDEREEGKGNRLHMRAVRPQVGASPSDPVRADRPGEISRVVSELQAAELEHARGNASQATSQKVGVVPRRDDHKRVTCNHCGARVLTRNSGAMWGHSNATGVECIGSKSWDY